MSTARFLFAGLAAAGFASLAGCGSEEQENVPDTTPPGVAQVARPAGPLSLADQHALGAARFLPADTSLFCSAHDLADLWRDLRESNAAKRLMSFPFARKALGDLWREGVLKDFETARQRDPRIDGVVEALADAFSREVFVWAGAEAPEFLDAVVAAYGEILFSKLEQDLGLVTSEADLARRVVAVLFAHERALNVPPVVLGFKVFDTDLVRDVLTDVFRELRESTDIPIELVEINRGKYYRIRLVPSLVPGWDDELTYQLRTHGVSHKDARRLLALAGSQRVTIAAGVREGYLLVSIGAGDEHLTRLGQNPTLAQAHCFGVLSGRLKPKVLTLTYLSPKMRSVGRLSKLSRLGELQDPLTAMPAGETSAELRARLRNDVARLLEDMDASLPEPVPYVAARLLDRGIETWEFGVRSHAGGAGDPLALLRCRGRDSLMFSAMRTAPFDESYERVARWISVLYGYFVDFALPRMPASEREGFEAVAAAMPAAAAELDRITRELLLPAIDASECLVTVDGGGELHELPGGGKLPRTMRFPRPALVIQARNTKHFVEAFAGYRYTINELLAEFAKRAGLDPVPQIPTPKAASFGGGTIYTFRALAGLPGGIEPNVLVTRSLVVLSTSREQAASIVSATAPSLTGGVELSSPSSAATSIDLAGLLKMAVDAVRVYSEYRVEVGEIDVFEKQMLLRYVGLAEELLGTVRGYASRTFVEHGVEARHSRLEIVDLPDLPK